MTDWIKCSDKMPTDDDEQYIIKGAPLNYLRIRDGYTINYIYGHISKYMYGTEWTPYTKELWEELNK
tara:strand:- start:1358 stop:1558 length:201 start_codon:yes stop_codon:yes gene_type:complete